MKPQLLDFIPLYGSYRYFKKYFNTDRRTSKEVILANWLWVYHSFVGSIFIMLLIKIIT